MHARSGGRVIYIGVIGLCERAGMAIPQGRGLRQPGRVAGGRQTVNKAVAAKGAAWKR